MATQTNETNANRTGARLDLFPTFKFHVEIGSITEGTFTDCSGLEMSTQYKEYEEGGNNSFVHVFPGRTKYSHVTLKRGFLLSNDIFMWYREMEECLRQGKPVKFRQVSIILNSTDFQGIMRWNLNDAFPVKWTGPGLRTNEAAVATESLEFAHHGISVQSGS
jgi:phage tail-like protein